MPKRLQETYRPILGIRAVVQPHYRLDRLGRFISIVEGDDRNVVVEDMGFNDSVE